MKFLIGNWKMHGQLQEINTFFAKSSEAPSTLRPIICLPFVYLSAVTLPKGYALGAQDCSSHPEGPFTGQISSKMLKDVGCQYVIVGHPEGVSSGEENLQKATNAVAAGLIPIICIRTLEGLEQTIPLLDSPSDSFMLAYEPAVGSSTLPDTLIADAKKLRSFRPKGLTHLLYGGGISPQTLPFVKDLFDGFLVGRASREISSWNTLIDLLS